MTVFLVACAAVLVYAVYYVWLYVLRRPAPGPFVWPVLGNSPQQLRSFRENTFFETLREWSLDSRRKGYGGTFSIYNPGRSVLIGIVDPRDVKHILVDAFGRFGKPPELRPERGGRGA